MSISRKGLFGQKILSAAEAEQMLGQARGATIQHQISLLHQRDKEKSLNRKSQLQQFLQGLDVNSIKMGELTKAEDFYSPAELTPSALTPYSRDLAGCSGAGKDGMLPLLDQFKIIVVTEEDMIIPQAPKMAPVSHRMSVTNNELWTLMTMDDAGLAMEQMGDASTDVTEYGDSDDELEEAYGLERSLSSRISPTQEDMLSDSNDKTILSFLRAESRSQQSSPDTGQRSSQQSPVNLGVGTMSLPIEAVEKYSFRRFRNY
jgi:hypothetical protein